MAIEDLKERIVKKARDDADKQLDDARNEAAEIISKSKLTAQATKKTAWEELNKQIDQQRARAKAGAELEAEKMVLNKKKELIESVFEDVKEKVSSLDAKTRKADLQKLMKKADKELTVAKVYCNKKDTDSIKGAKAVSAPILGGLIAEEKSGKISLDLSYDSMLEVVREQTAKNVAEILLK